MKTITIPLFFLALTIGITSYAQSQVLEPKDYQALANSKANKVVLDVRTAPEFAQGHLSGAVMIDFNQANFKENVLKLDKSKPVFVYCAAGARSKNAASVLVDLGFKQVFDLRGGLHAWKSAGLPVVK